MGRRVYEVAKELGVESKEVIKRLQDSGEIVDGHLAPLSKEQEDKIRKLFAVAKEGEVQVKKMAGGRIVRRRPGATSAARSDSDGSDVDDIAAVEPEPVAARAVEEKTEAPVESVVEQVVSEAPAPAGEAPKESVEVVAPSVAAPVETPAAEAQVAPEVPAVEVVETKPAAAPEAPPRVRVVEQAPPRPAGQGDRPREYGSDRPRPTGDRPREYGSDRPRPTGERPREYGSDRPREYGADRPRPADRTSGSDRPGGDRPPVERTYGANRQYGVPGTAAPREPVDRMGRPVPGPVDIRAVKEVIGAAMPGPRDKSERLERDDQARRGRQRPTSKKDDEETRAREQLAKEALEKKKVGKKLIFDTGRGVISLQDFTVADDDAPEHVEARPQGRRRPQQRPAPRRGKAHKTMLTMPNVVKRNIRLEGDEISVSDLARRMSLKATELVRKLVGMGVMAALNHSLDFDTATILASEYGFTIEKVGFDLSEQLKEIEDNADEMVPRCPVITVMGHVDHGKTTLLDRIRNASVADHEAGGITQHIGAYKVKTEGGDIVFLDTPGHEAFTAMRARGASATDIVILMVAADDGVMAQTKEAIAHARASGAPIIVAINKIDKPDANLERVRQELSLEGLISEEWGGDTIICEVSAKKGIGIDKLMEMILLQSEVMELKANPNKAARGVVLESSLDRNLGPVATVLVQSGTLRAGDAVVSGMAHGRVRIMIDDKGRQISEAGPSTPVRVAGLDIVPDAGDLFAVVADEKKAREIAEFHIEANRKERATGGTARVSLEDLFQLFQAGDVKDLKVILKADVQGSMAPLVDSVLKLKHPEIVLKIIHQGVGNVAESDVNLAIASNAVIVGFNVAIDPKAKALADQEKVDIKKYSVIYDVIDDLRKAMEGLLAPKLVAKLVGKAEVRQVFSVSKVGKIAGSYVFEGVVNRNCTVHVMREGKKMFEGKLHSLKRFKDDAREVKAGLECGIGVDGFEGTLEKDILEFYEFEEVRETISTPHT